MAARFSEGLASCVLRVTDCLGVPGYSQFVPCTSRGNHTPVGWLVWLSPSPGARARPRRRTSGTPSPSPPPSRLFERESCVCQGCGVGRRHMGGAAHFRHRENGGQGGEQEVCGGSHGGPGRAAGLRRCSEGDARPARVMHAGAKPQGSPGCLLSPPVSFVHATVLPPHPLTRTHTHTGEHHPGVGGRDGRCRPCYSSGPRHRLPGHDQGLCWRRRQGDEGWLIAACKVQACRMPAQSGSMLRGHSVGGGVGSWDGVRSSKGGGHALTALPDGWARHAGHAHCME